MGQSSSRNRDALSDCICRLMQLADVELQLIMKGLNALEIVRFACCNRHLLFVADNSFAWKHVSIRVDSLKTLQSLALFDSNPSHDQSLIMAKHANDSVSSAAVPPSLRRHISHFSLRWPFNSSNMYVEDHEIDVLSLALDAIMLPMWKLEICSHGILTRQLNRILDWPNMQQLRVLRLFDHPTPGQVDADSLRLICSLPHLHTFIAATNDASTDAWSYLRSTHALTSLEITDGYSHNDQTHLFHVAECIHLTQLCIIAPRIYDLTFAAFITSPLMCANLCVLQLEDYDGLSFGVGDESAAASLAAAFSTFVQLHTLHLIAIRNIDLMLPHLIHISSMQLLFLQPDRDPSGFPELSSSITDPILLAQLLIDAPSLQCNFNFFPSDRKFREKRSPSILVREANRVMQKYRKDAQLQLLGMRLILHCTPPIAKLNRAKK